MSGIPSKNWQPPFVHMETSMGPLTVELYWDHAPDSCRNFAELARRGYYNGLIFHRIISDFMIQGGDPSGTGRGGSSIYGDTFHDEVWRHHYDVITMINNIQLHPDLKHTGAGICSMANSGKNTNGSQFFITLGPTQWLDGKHTIFGRIAKGESYAMSHSLWWVIILRNESGGKYGNGENGCSWSADRQS